MRVLRGLVTARVIGTRIRALVQGNGERARVGTGLGKRVVRAVVIERERSRRPVMGYSAWRQKECKSW